MTAIVGVLNKHAVAIAADSAVTMGNTHKVVNSANKIFTLSKYHPVAVMTYSSVSAVRTGSFDVLTPQISTLFSAILLNPPYYLWM